MLGGLKRSVSKLPKGVINKRKKRYKDRVYSYYYLKYRDGEKVVNKHISKEEIQAISKKLDQRKKYEKEMQSYKKRIDYLNRIIRLGNKRGHANSSQE
ncbi:MAG: hypothetical protein L0922_07360 [Candidatus Mariimomonas ferrooxydans]